MSSSIDEKYGTWCKIECPFCDYEIEDLYDYGLVIERDESCEGDSIKCDSCEKEFLIRFGYEYDVLVAEELPEGFKSPSARFAKMKEDLDERFSQMILEVIKKDEQVFIAYIKTSPESRMMSCMIVITQEGITIIGDWVPKTHGINSAFGYGLNWFSNQCYSDYLREKFCDIESYSYDHALLCAIQKCFSDRMQENREESVDYILQNEDS